MVQNRRIGGGAVLSALLALFASGASASPQMATPGWESFERMPASASVAHPQLQRRAEHVEPYADGVIDTFEDDDSGRGEARSSCPERFEFSVGACPSVQQPASDVLPRSHLARGPPFA